MSLLGSKTIRVAWARDAHSNIEQPLAYCEATVGGLSDMVRTSAAYKSALNSVPITREQAMQPRMPVNVQRPRTNSADRLQTQTLESNFILTRKNVAIHPASKTARPKINLSQSTSHQTDRQLFVEPAIRIFQRAFGKNFG